MTEIRDSLEVIVQTADYGLFLKSVVPAIKSLLKAGTTPQFLDSPEQVRSS